MTNNIPTLKELQELFHKVEGTDPPVMNAIYGPEEQLKMGIFKRTPRQQRKYDKRLERMFGKNDTNLTCEICKGNTAIGFYNPSYYNMYTVRCDFCNTEVDYATKKHYEDAISKKD